MTGILAVILLGLAFFVKVLGVQKGAFDWQAVMLAGLFFLALYAVLTTGLPWRK